MISTQLYPLENSHWQIGVLPRTGASIAYGRFSFVGEDFQLEKPSSDGTARHGVVGQRAWVVDSILQLEQGGTL